MNLIKLGEGTKVVKQYGYGEARVHGIYLEINRDTPEGEDLERDICEACSGSLENHTVYELKASTSNKKLYVYCNDLTIKIAAEIIKEG